MAVITLLGLLGLIIVPIVTNTIEKQRKGAFEASVNGILDLATAFLKLADNIGLIPTLLIGGGGIAAAIKSIKGDGRPKCRVSKVNMPLVA